MATSIPPAEPSSALVPVPSKRVAALAGPTSYTTLEEAMTVTLPPGSAMTNGPSSQHHLVDVYALVIHCSEPAPTKGSDWIVRAKLVDGTWGSSPSEVITWQLQEQGGAMGRSQNQLPQQRRPASVLFFGPPHLLPAPARGGGAGVVRNHCDIIRIHRAQVCDYTWQGSSGRNLVAKVGPSPGHPASFLLYDGRPQAESESDAAITPYAASSRSFSWEPQAEPKMLEALRMLSSYLATSMREAEEAVAALAAEDEGEEGFFAGFGNGEGATAATTTTVRAPLLLMGPPPSAIRHLGHVFSGEAGCCDLGPVRVEAVEREAATGATVLWVFDGTDAPPLSNSRPGGGEASAGAKVTLARLSAVLAEAARRAEAARLSAAAAGEENVDAAATAAAAAAAAANGENKVPVPGGNDAIVVPACPARDAAELPAWIRAVILGGSPDDDRAGRRRSPPAPSSLSSSSSGPPLVGTLLPVVLALPRGAPPPPLPAVGAWVTIHKLAVASVGGGGGDCGGGRGGRQGGGGRQAVGVYLESSHWARAALASPGEQPFRADPAAREREGDTASWAPRDHALLVAVPRTTAAGDDGGDGGNDDGETKKRKGKKRGRGGEAALAPLPARATLRALELRARETALAEARASAGGTGGDDDDDGDDGEEDEDDEHNGGRGARARRRRRRRRGAAASAAAVRARVLCRILRAEPASSSSSPPSSSSSPSFFDLDLLLEDATGLVEAGLTGREAAAFFGRGGGRGGASSSSSSSFPLAERCAGLVQGADPENRHGAGPWAELVLEARVVESAAAASENKKRRGGGGGGGGGNGGGKEEEKLEEVAFSVVDSGSRWPLPSVSAVAPSPPIQQRVVASSPLAATQAAVPGSAAPASALEATQAPPQQSPLLAPTQAVVVGREQQLAPTQAVGLAEKLLLSPLRNMGARVRRALPGGGRGAGQGE